MNYCKSITYPWFKVKRYRAIPSAFEISCTEGPRAISRVTVSPKIVYLIERTHGCARGRNNIVDEEEEGVLGTQMNSLADQEVELSYS